MFKKLVRKITECTSMDELFRLEPEIDKAFEKEQITFSDHELLYNLIGMIVIKEA